MKTRLLVIQPTTLCNINCQYCYLPYRGIDKRIDEATLEQIFKTFFASSFVGDKVSCVWHAGEPLIMPRKFYLRAFQIQQKWNTQGIAIINSFQTNATLITQEWCDFFQEHQVRVGVSIDGPQHLHDAQRVDRGNHGTFERVVCGIELLRKNQIPFSVISVVTNETVRIPDEFWHFFMDLQPTSLGLNPEEVEGCHEQSSLHSPEGIALYQKFIQRLMLLNTQSTKPLRIREIDVLMRRIESGYMLARAETNTPGAILSFDYKGNISTFSPELLSYENFVFGNVFEHSLEETLQQEPFQATNAAIQSGVARCKESCQYFSICGGGAPSNKLYENKTFDSTETNACRLRIKATADTLLAHLEEKYHLV